MRYYYDGNLAEKHNRQSVPYELPDVYVPQLDEIDPDHGKRERRLVEKNNIRLQYKSLKRWRVRVSLRLLSVLLILATAVGYVVWRGAKLTEMSFYNAGLKRQIKEIDKENSLLQDKILNKTSLYDLKNIASVTFQAAHIFLATHVPIRDVGLVTKNPTLEQSVIPVD
jgi:hypothetical protein